MSIRHLARRYVGSLSTRPPAAADQAWAGDHLLAGEYALWQAAPVADQRHSLLVARRFVARRSAATRAEIAGALLHDIGKTRCGLGTTARVVATLVGPRTRRFRVYFDHERLGAELAAAVGSDAVTVGLIEGRGPAAADLRAADHI